jgi:hypothetical protein
MSVYLFLSAMWYKTMIENLDDKLMGKEIDDEYP